MTTEPLPRGVVDAVFVDASPIERWAVDDGGTRPVMAEQWASMPGPAAEAVEMLAHMIDQAACQQCGAGVGLVLTGDADEGTDWALCWVIVAHNGVARVLCEDHGNAEMGV